MSAFHPPADVFGRPALQPDGKILISQALDSRSSQISRLNTNGSLDNTFSVFLPNGFADVVAFLTDGRMIITGSFHLQDGRDARIARLNTNGTFDTTFDPGTGPDDTIRAFVLQPDGKILIGGNFFNYNGTSRNCMARLNVNGSIDTSFVPIDPNTFQNSPTTLPKPVGALALQPDGKVLAGGRYERDVQLATPNNVFRLNTDGSLDTSFPLGTGLEGSSQNVNAIMVQSDGQVLIGGGFNVVNGVPSLGLARVIAATVSTPTPTPTPTPGPTPSPTPIPGVSTIQFNQSDYSARENLADALINVTRTGDLSGTSTVDFATVDVPATVGCEETVKNLGAAYSRCDYSTTVTSITFAPGEAMKEVQVPVVNDAYSEGPESFQVKLTNPQGSTLGTLAIANVVIDDTVQPDRLNPNLEADFFIRAHYSDFLGREPDQAGLAFWISTITSCGTDQQCVEVKRINASAAFFLSIEFQHTGYLVERLYKVAYGDKIGTSTFNGPHQLAVPIINYDELLADAREISKGVVVNQGNWQQQLENNKQAFTAEFVQRSRFITALPNSMSAAQFVDTLNANAGTPLSVEERNQLVNGLTAQTMTRAQVLRAVAEDPDLVSAEFNRAFVLMQYLGYLRRNPNDPLEIDYSGFDFWLTKLDQFHGNFVNAEMVKAFIASIEYRQRFGP